MEESGEHPTTVRLHHVPLLQVCGRMTLNVFLRIAAVVGDGEIIFKVAWGVSVVAKHLSPSAPRIGKSGKWRVDRRDVSIAPSVLDVKNGGDDGTRTRGLCRDRAAF